MAEPDNIVLVYLRRLDETMDRLTDEVRDLKLRVAAVEEGWPAFIVGSIGSSSEASGSSAGSISSLRTRKSTA